MTGQNTTLQQQGKIPAGYLVAEREMLEDSLGILGRQEVKVKMTPLEEDDSIYFFSAERITEDGTHNNGGQR